MRAQMAIFLSLILVSLNAPAFSQDECGDLFPRVSEKHPPYMSPIYTSTMAPSTTSYVSSWGKCSMYGYSPAVQRDNFVASSGEEISREAASGAGEYLQTLASLSGCAKSVVPDFTKQLQANYSRVFNEASASSITKNLDDVIRAHPNLNRNCVLPN